MKNQFLPNHSPDLRLQTLRDNAERTEVLTYAKELDQAEMANMKDELTDTSIKLARLEEKRQEFMTIHKAEVKPLKEIHNFLLNTIRNGAEEVEEEVYLLADQENGQMMYYNSDGMLIKSRPLMKEERQFRILPGNNEAI